MIIKNITISNFQSYFGTQEMPLSSGLNLIVGLGGKGKSKLFNAFYWALFGNIYITDLGWKPTLGLPGTALNCMEKHEFINKRALYLAEEDQEVTAYVLLEIEDDKKITYRIERSVQAKRLSCPDWNSPKAWNVYPETLKVYYDGIHGSLTKVNIEAERIIGDLFPEEIRNYIWFQGESLDQLINFRDEKTLKDAVQHISYYPYYEKLSKIIQLSRAKIEDMETKKTKLANKHNSAVSALISTMEILRKRIATEESNRDKISENLELMRASLATDETKYQGIANFSELIAKYKDAELAIQKHNADLTILDNKQRELVPNRWILRGIEPMINQCEDLINNYTEEINSCPTKKYLDDPGRNKLEEILHSGQCFVCGAEVKEGNERYQWVVNRIHEQEKYLREREEFENNLAFLQQFNVFFGKISSYPSELAVPLQSIDKQWKESEDAIEKLIALRAKQISLKKGLDSEIEDVKKHYGVDPVAQAQQAGQVFSTIRATRQNIEKENLRLKTSTDAITKWNQELHLQTIEYEKLKSKDSSITDVEETEWKNISIFLEDICARVQESARKELLRKVEETANKFYKQFTQHDNGYKGCVKINDDYSIEYDAGLNTSHEDRKKMSIINALLYLNQQAMNTYFPFISDAPTSNFDDTTTHKYLLGIKDIFNQSIVMTKDVTIGSKEYEELISSPKVSTVYELTSKRFCPDGQEPQIYEVSTQINERK